MDRRKFIMTTALFLGLNRVGLSEQSKFVSFKDENNSQILIDPQSVWGITTLDIDSEEKYTLILFTNNGHISCVKVLDDYNYVVKKIEKYNKNWEAKWVELAPKPKN